MVAKDRGVRRLLEELLGAEGAAFAVLSGAEHCASGEAISFFALAARVQAREGGAVLCGYQSTAEINDTVMNPRDKHVAREWADFNLVIIEGED